MTRVKICGITRGRDARTAIKYGADALGFVFEPTSPRCQKDGRLIAEIQRDFPWTTTVAVFANVADIEIPLASWVQAITGEPVDAPLIRTVRVQPDVQPYRVTGAEAVLLDAYHSSQFGGTGTRLDLDLAEAWMEKNKRSVILAGGLTPDNVGDVVRRLKPYAVDVSSGVEVSPGIKDPVKIRDFIQAVQDASR